MNDNTISEYKIIKGKRYINKTIINATCLRDAEVTMHDAGYPTYNIRLLWSDYIKQYKSYAGYTNNHIVINANDYPNRWKNKNN